MTETQVDIAQLQKNIAHLAEVTSEKWVLKWGDTPQTAFEIVCRNTSVMQIEKLESLLTEGHLKALATLK